MSEIEQVKEFIVRELPGIMERDPGMREFILRLSRQHFADKEETESRFDRLLEELRRDREKSDRRWEENNRRWEENNRRWEEHLREFRAMQEENNRRWEEHLREFRAMQEENNRRWEEHLREFRAMQEENNRRWEENNRRWEENTAQINSILDALKAQARKHDQSIGALGARWGVQTEAAFRNALAGILGDLFDVQVTHVTEYDPEGKVFGHPDQVELDLIVKDGLLVIGEIKSSVSKEEMYLFERKARFYEELHGRRADRLLIISPMVEDAAREVARRLGIEVYSYAEDAGAALSGDGSST